MYESLLSAHNILRWVILILLVLNVLRHLTAVNRNFTATDKRLSLFLLISAHITLLVGIYQWVVGDWGLPRIQELGMGEVMKNGSFRFFAIEHPVGMLIAIALITVAHSTTKKDLPHATKHKRMLLLQFIALVAIMVIVPWPFREAVARPLLRY
jgi:hypothetical protein